MGRELTTAEVLELLAELGQPVAPSTWRSYVTRGQAPARVGRQGRDPLYDEDDIRAWARTRPGQGARTDLKEKHMMLGTEINALALTGEAVETIEGRPLGRVGRYSGSTLHRWSDGRWLACYHGTRSENEGLWRELTEEEARQWREYWTSAQPWTGEGS